MQCQALSLTASAAQALAVKLACGEPLHPVTRSTAGLFLETLGHTLERLEAEEAGQLTFLQERFYLELFGDRPSVAREAPTNSFAALARSQSPQC